MTVGEDDVTRRGGMSVGKKRVASRPFGSTVTRMMTRRAVEHFHGIVSCSVKSEKRAGIEF